mmetsp:Transcript_8365/g.18046  ORF Transcript_8365/g.18046 Transcript_8365/m.18046 type:complete len:260 (-) Transcript_8365:995-1774(-)
MTTPDPPTTNVDREEIDTFSGNGNLTRNSPGQHAKSGLQTIAGPGTTSIPPYTTGSASFTPQPRLRRKMRWAAYWSASPVAAVPEGVPLACRAAPSATAFLTGLKQMLASAWVKPTCVDSSAFNTVGNSCIMHSNRVGFLKTVLVLSLYFGLTKSGMTPWVRSKILLYPSNWNTSWLMFPGKGEYPVASSFTSPSLNSSVDRRRGSNWLYSTLTVLSWPVDEFLSLVIPPIAWLAFRGTHNEFIIKPCCCETPSKRGSV